MGPLLVQPGVKARPSGEKINPRNMDGALVSRKPNLMELLETVSKSNEPGHEVAVHVLTAEDEFSADKQSDNFQKMAEACSGIGITF